MGSGLLACLRHAAAHLCTRDAVFVPQRADVWCEPGELLLAPPAPPTPAEPLLASPALPAAPAPAIHPHEDVRAPPPASPPPPAPSLAALAAVRSPSLPDALPLPHGLFRPLAAPVLAWSFESGAGLPDTPQARCAGACCSRQQRLARRTHVCSRGLLLLRR